MKLPTFQGSVDWLKDNFFDLVTLWLAFRLYVNYQQNPPSASELPSISASILGILALIAFSGFWERNMRLRRIERSTNKTLTTVQENIVERPSALRFFERTPVLDAYFKSAHIIDLMGVTLTSTLDKQTSNIREAINNGARVRVILANPSPKSLATKMATLRSEEPHVEAFFRKKLASSFEVLEYLRRKHEDQSGKSGRFDVHMVDYAPSFGIASFDFGQPNGNMFVEIYSHVSGYDTQIAFSLTNKRDGSWFSYFQNQFEDIWHNSIEWKPEKK